MWSVVGSFFTSVFKWVAQLFIAYEAGKKTMELKELETENEITRRDLAVKAASAGARGLGTTGVIERLRKLKTGKK